MLRHAARAVQGVRTPRDEPDAARIRRGFARRERQGVRTWRSNVCALAGCGSGSWALPRKPPVGGSRSLSPDPESPPSQLLAGASRALEVVSNILAAGLHQRLAQLDGLIAVGPRGVTPPQDGLA